MGEDAPAENPQIDVSDVAEVAKDSLGLSEQTTAPETDPRQQLDTPTPVQEAQSEPAHTPRRAEDYADPMDFFMSDDPYELSSAKNNPTPGGDEPKSA